MYNKVQGKKKTNIYIYKICENVYEYVYKYIKYDRTIIINSDIPSNYQGLNDIN